MLGQRKSLSSSISTATTLETHNSRQYHYISFHQDLASLELRGHTTFKRNVLILPIQQQKTILVILTIKFDLCVC